MKLPVQSGRWLGTVLFVLLMAGALGILHRTLHGFHYHEIIRDLSTTKPWKLAAAMTVTLASYLVMTWYDRLAVRYIDHPLPQSKVTLASFISYAFSNNLGMSLLTSGTIRFRLYSSWGLNTEEIGKVVAFTTLSFWLGILAVAGAVFCIEAQALPILPHLSGEALRPAGFLFLAITLGYLVLTVVVRQPVRVRQWSFRLPSPSLALLQLLVGSCDWLLAGTVLYLLLPQEAYLSFGQLLAIYIGAQIIALASHVPGGIGVFESLVLLAAKDIPASALAGSLLLYRGIYYLLPLILAGLLAGANEYREHQAALQRVTTLIGRWSAILIPHLLAATTLVSGAILLLSGATPAEPGRLHWLEDILPLPVIELSHFLASLIGAALLLLARGLQKRLDVAFLLSTVMLAAGSLFSLLKGGDFEEAILLLLMLLALLPCRRQFHRRASLFETPFSIGWILTILLVLVTALGLVLFAYRHIDYSNELWWRFALSADAPRSLRAAIGAAALLFLFTLSRLLRAAPPTPEQIGDQALPTIRAIVDQCPNAMANLALLGDKRLLFNENGTALIMYGIEGRSWVALGDPLGPKAEAEELAWRFRDLCERHDGWPIFYEVGPDMLALYIDLGMTLLKLGEEARVRLANFTIEGKRRSGLRYTHRRMLREGITFSIAPTEAIPDVLDELERISDGWLAEKHTREKGFSLGYFDRAYLCANPVALIRNQGQVIAFANIWTGAGKSELSIDLMRHTSDAPRNVMEFLFICLMLWGQDQGYQWFNLGMAPLSGLENRSGSPLWNRLGSLIYHHAEHFYNFQGLREYKEKFDPEWQPRYLATPGGIALPRILANITALISGGVTGIFRK